MVSQIEKTDNLTTITLCFVLAGGIGNLLDRVFRGFVIDYIDITLLFPSPIFNLADIYIVCGWLILVLLTIKNFLGEAKQKSYQN
jgi:signal peptidase II